MNTTNLKAFSDGELISQLKNSVTQEREILTKVLKLLRKVEQRKLYLARGYASLFDFVRLELGYSEAAAMRRINAMRLIKEVPQVEEKVAKGSLSLTVANQIQSYFRRENIKRKQEKKPNLSPQDKLELTKKMEGASSRQCEKTLASLSPESVLPKEKQRAITEDKVLLQIVADQGFMKKLEKLKQLTRHQNSQGELVKVLDKALTLALEKMDPEQREARREKRKAKMNKLDKPIPFPAQKVKVLHRRIPQKTRDRVWVRDKGNCQYIDTQTGKKCGSESYLQVDHIQPFALGGGHEESNLRLLCGKHNRYFSIKTFGPR